MKVIKVKELFVYFLRRVKRDSIALEAGDLSFTTVLALVPAMTIMLAVFTVIPSFAAVRDALSSFATKNFVPVFSETVNEYIGSLVSHAGSLTVTSMLFLFVVSLMLVRSIDQTLNKIWRGGHRKLGPTLAIYWTLLTLGPLAVGLIVWITTKVLTYAFATGASAGTPLLVAYFIFPIIEIVVVTTVFVVVPSTQVKIQDALLGAVLVTAAFEISKKLFSVYVIYFSNYASLYGALAALPALMLWIYINWWIVLLGAEFTATLGAVRGGVSSDVPSFMVYLANVTGSTLGSDSISKASKKARISIKISKKSGVS